MRKHALPLLAIATLVIGAFWFAHVGRTQAAPFPPKCEHRKPIRKLPFTIDKCGSYFLTKCLTGEAGMNGITIDADDVTLDLNGFSLNGAANSLDGISIVNSRENSLIFGGSITGWEGHGINLGTGDGHVTRDCTVRNNLGTGIFITSSNNKVVNNVCQSNGEEGIWVMSGSGNLVDGNFVAANKRGIKASSTGNLILRNHASGNTNQNYDTDGGSGKFFGQIMIPVSNFFSSTNPYVNFEY